MASISRRWTLSCEDEGFPASLKDLSEPPELIHGIGSAEALSGPCISIIGARRATPYGLAVAEMAARVAAECGITVVSGGAMGCDHAAGLAAIRHGGKTVIVSGCGADVIYPASSGDLYEGAVATGGAVISTERWGRGPRRWSFPMRNRLIAALSLATVVTEAGIASGTMSTAEAAAELDRILYAIPGSIFSPGSSGTNRLIAEGARVIPDEQSLGMSIALDYGVARLSSTGHRRSGGPLMSALVASPSRPDELSERTNEDVLTVMRTLTDYEARGLVERLPDGRYAPTRFYYLGHNDGS